MAPRKAAAPKRKLEDDTTASRPSKKARAAKAASTKPAAATAAKKPGRPPKTSLKSTKEQPAAANNKRKRTADDTPAANKKARKGPIINEPPTQKLNIYVTGENSSGELGLGTAKIAKPVRRPRLNTLLDINTVGVVQLACGGMHGIALTHDNKILTWGVNDAGALGRNTAWEGGTRDMDEDSESEDEDSESPNGLNPFESVPGEVDWSQTALPEDTRFTQVAAGDSTSFVVTDDGHVYGWGTFRDSNGAWGLMEKGDKVTRPMLIPGIKDITSVQCCANVAFALTKAGLVYSWGCGEQNQLGRRVIERSIGKQVPQTFGLPTGKKAITSIHTGNDHAFAISKTGDVYAWGLNSFGQTGIPEGAGGDYATVTNPTTIKSLKGKEIVDIAGGNHHTVAATSTGECLAWGKVDAHQLGIDMGELDKLPADVTGRSHGRLRMVTAPQQVVEVEGHAVRVAAANDHSLAVTNEGHAYTWGFNENYQTGQGGEDDDINEAKLVDNSAVRDKHIVGAGSGAQFSMMWST